MEESKDKIQKFDEPVSVACHLSNGERIEFVAVIMLSEKANGTLTLIKTDGKFARINSWLMYDIMELSERQKNEFIG